MACYDCLTDDNSLLLPSEQRRLSADRCNVEMILASFCFGVGWSLCCCYIIWLTGGCKPLKPGQFDYPLYHVQVLLVF